MTTRQRDTQRQRLYDAEGVARARTFGPRRQTIPNDALQGYVDAVLARSAIAARWPGRKITVVLKRGGRAYGYPNQGRITLPAPMRNEFDILHEVAHCLVGQDHSLAWHGPEFAGVFAFLIQTMLGKPAADALREEYRNHRVRRRNTAIPAPTRREAKAEVAA